MGTREDRMPEKPSKPTSQETPATPSYPDWSSSMQAYYGAGATPPFFASTVASPPPHPYLWGSQHPLITPYGTPVPYLYPPGGVYAHPNTATGKTHEGKDRASNKKSKGVSGNIDFVAGKAGESRNVTSGSENDGANQSAEESASDGLSDTSDENANQQELALSKRGSFDQMLADGANAQSNSAGAKLQSSVPGNPVVSMPATNLNIGMDLWNASPVNPGAMKRQPNPPSISSAVPATIIGREGVMPDQWIQNERDLKRQKRKQSNRESARRSRLRKQAEYEELQARVETLNNENSSLRNELETLSEECGKITSENNSIKEELTRVCGPEVVSKLENNSLTVHTLSRSDEGNT